MAYLHQQEPATTRPSLKSLASGTVPHATCAVQQLTYRITRHNTGLTQARETPTFKHIFQIQSQILKALICV